MASFKYKGQLVGEQAPGTLSLIIANSATITVGGAVILTAGYVAPATAGVKVLGICIGITTNKGLPMDNATSGKDYTGTWTSGGPGVGTFVAASNNATVSKVRAVVIIDTNATFVNVTAATIAVGTLGGFYNLTSATQIAAYAAGEVAGQFQLVGLDPDSDAVAAKGLFKIAESQLDPYMQS